MANENYTFARKQYILSTTNKFSVVKGSVRTTKTPIQIERLNTSKNWAKC